MTSVCANPPLPAPDVRPRGGRRWLGLWLLLGVGLALCGLNLVAPALISDGVVNRWAASAVYLVVPVLVLLRARRAPGERSGFVLLAAGLSLYGLGYVLWTFWIGREANPPVPSLCDGLWLSFYPLAGAGLALLGPRVRRGDLRALVDSVIVAGTVAAGACVVVLGPVLASVSGHSLAVITEIAYPAGDIALAAIVVGTLSLGSWRLSRRRAVMAAGYLLLALADSLIALQVAHQASSQPTQFDNFLYLLGTGLLGVAVWQPETTRPPRAGSPVLIPSLFAAAALGLLFSDHQHRLNSGAWGCAVLVLLAAIGRMFLAFADARGRALAEAEAGTDDLTGLANRRHFIRALEAAVSAARAGAEAPGLLLLDLDHFKELNDTLGHAAGDTLLTLVGPRLGAHLAPTDRLARLGGDEFAILLGAGAATAEARAAALRASFDDPFLISGLALRITASVGIASYPEDGTDVNDLLRRADIALYQAKSSRTGHARYAQDRDTHSAARLTIAHELAEAIPRGELCAHFQPQVDRDGQVVGAEALVRWCRPDGSVVAPAEFLPAVEQAGLARELTRHVLDEALAACHGWRRAGRDLHVAVNLTVADLLDDRFPEEVAAALAHHGIPADRLVLEVTESSILSDPVRIASVLGRLDALGVVLSLDDFGTGFSSLAHLRELPVRELKVDRSFVMRMTDSTADAAIVSSIVLLARRLGLRCVAEGVETAEGREALAELGCDLLQGYLFSRPLAPGAFAELLGTDRSGPRGWAILGSNQ